MRFVLILLCVYLLFFAIGCTDSRYDTDYVSKLSENGAFPPQEEYMIQAGDQLDIKLFYNSELNESVAVRPDGRISLQLVGQIKVSDMSPSDLEKMLIDKYSSYLAKPEVTVIVRSFNMYKVFVDGYVEKPGAFPLIGYMTLMQAVSYAGGLKTGSLEEDILVIRRSDKGKPVVLRIDLSKAMSGQDMSQDIYLAPFDIVYVPKSSISNVNQFVDLYIRRNLPVGAGVGYSIPNY